MTDDPSTILTIWRDNRAIFAASRGALPERAVTLARASIAASRSMIHAIDDWSPDDIAAIDAEIDACEALLNERVGAPS